MTQADSDDLTIGVMTRDDLDLAIEWAAAEGWNPGLDDAECFRAADPAGFLMGRLGGEPVVSISVVRYGDTFGTVHSGADFDLKDLQQLIEIVELIEERA